MHVTVIKGRVDRIYYHPVERTLYLMLEGAKTIHELRNSAEDGKVSILLTKPGDEIVLHERGGHIEKWSNVTMSETPG